jgi:phage I-like protein
MGQARLLTELANLPEWLRILPRGRVELVDGRESLDIDGEALAEMVAAFQARGVDLVVDYEHQSLKGQRAPAAGWIKELTAREDGLWARVEWTPQAKAYLSNREYRYFSPVLKLNPETRRPEALLQMALTNVPAIRGLAPLVARFQGAMPAEALEATALAKAAQEARSREFGIGIKAGGHVSKPQEWQGVPDEQWGDPVNYRYPCHTPENARAAWFFWRQPGHQDQYSREERARITARLRELARAQNVVITAAEKEKAGMWEELKTRMGLPPEAGEERLWGQVQEWWRELALSLDLPEEATTSQLLGTVAALKDSAGRLEVLQEELAGLKARLAEEQALKSVEEALRAGKISPAQRAWALEYCRQDPEGFQTYVAKVPQLVPVGAVLRGLKEEPGEPALDPEELEICQQLNITPSQYLAAKAQIAPVH